MTSPVSRTIAAAAAALLLTMPLPALAQSKKEPTAGQLAARERMSKCSAEWKAAKASGNVTKDMKWPKFWSACNKRLKGGDKA
ncbi:hypothetical protein [Microvirga thermotolerans]|uniref:Phosphate starvation-inducible protein PsiF n=1 Tax=Microvirga thermotolerans TaxID=2651334 RepID=A0A5P9K226_9HYPH|nr:hypothetical protein [Microvirga thermotolerans]QFU16254.1 hypothetical protein GDR74_08470 [Microvirga thermotolerans]